MRLRLTSRPAPGLLGIIGDPHAEDELLESALAHLRALGATQLLCTGDVVDGAGDVGRTVDLLRENDVLTVGGNHDRWLHEGVGRDWPASTSPAELTAEQQHWLATLPATRTVPSALGDIMLCHGLGADDMNRLRVDDDSYALDWNEEMHRILATPRRPALVVKGHTHRPGVGSPGGLLVLDAGTLEREHGPSVAVLDTGDRDYRRWEWTGGVWTLAHQHRI